MELGHHGGLGGVAAWGHGHGYPTSSICNTEVLTFNTVSWGKQYALDMSAMISAPLMRTRHKHRPAKPAQEELVIRWELVMLGRQPSTSQRLSWVHPAFAYAAMLMQPSQHAPCPLQSEKVPRQRSLAPIWLRC